MPIHRANLYTRENLLNSISAIRSLIDESGQIINRHNSEPTASSLATQERSNFPNEELIKDVHYRGNLSMEAAADHLMVFADSISEPAKTIAPWTCVRGLLESCALAVWFLDPMIDARTRVGRCFAFRYSGFTEQIKYFQVEKLYSQINRVNQRIKKVENDAITLGYPQLLNKKGETCGIAQNMPSIVELVGTTLDREGEYRLLSGVAHGHHWAISQIGFRPSEENPAGQQVKAFEKYLHPEGVIFATNLAVTAFAKVFWCLSELYGWDRKETISLLDRTYDQLSYHAKSRVWRSVTKRQSQSKPKGANKA
jgi:hypothetical protein